MARLSTSEGVSGSERIQSLPAESLLLRLPLSEPLQGRQRPEGLQFVQALSCTRGPCLSPSPRRVLALVGTNSGLAAVCLRLDETAISQIRFNQRQGRRRKLMRLQGQEYLLQLRLPLSVRLDQDFCVWTQAWMVHLSLATKRHLDRFKDQREIGIRADNPGAGTLGWGYRLVSAVG